jgi:transcriptional regulator with XRE-family HTH domain
LAGKQQSLSYALRHWRGRLSPEEAGIERPLRGRSTGLRREDVAMLAGISLTWYARFESGIEVHVSPALLERIARILRLSGQESVELFSLAMPEVGRSMDILLREVDELAIDALPRIDVRGLNTHVAWLDAAGNITMTQAHGPKAPRLLGLGSMPLGDFPNEMHIVEDASALPAHERGFYDSLGLRSSACSCVRRSHTGSLWIGYTAVAPHHFERREIDHLEAISNVLRLLHRDAGGAI